MTPLLILGTKRLSGVTSRAGVALQTRAIPPTRDPLSRPEPQPRAAFLCTPGTPFDGLSNRGHPLASRRKALMGVRMRKFTEADFPLGAVGHNVYRRTEGSPIAHCVEQDMAAELAKRLNRDNQCYPDEAPSTVALPRAPGITLEQMVKWFSSEKDAADVRMSWDEFKLIGDEFLRLRGALEALLDLDITEHSKEEAVLRAGALSPLCREIVDRALAPPRSTK